MPVTFHSLEDASTAPEGVQKLVANLQRPLSGKQKLESLPSMTPLALAQLQRVQDQASDTCSTADSFDTVSSVANLVLTTTAAIEQLSGEVDGLEARSMVPHWYTLLRTIARASHPDAHISGQTSFVHPRGFGGEGIAEMIMGFAADKAVVGLNLEPEHSEHSDMDDTSLACAEDLDALVEDHRSICESGVSESSDEDDDSDDDEDEDSDDDDMEYDEEDHHTEESYDEARDHPIYSAEPAPIVDIREPNEAELFFGLDAIDEHEPPEETWLDLPNWSHILAGRHSGPVVLFPILCVASETEIVPLMASAAYQRHAWGVDLPVVGLSISASSCSARVYIAWVDPLSDVQHMPTVHIMHPKSNIGTRTSDVLTLPGSFDLANPQSSLALAHFIFSLSYQFDILREELPSRRLRNFTWRSDDDATLWAGSIEEWRARIDVSDESSTSDASDTPSPITPKDIDTFTMPPKPPRGTANDRGRKRGQSRAVSSTVEGPSSTQPSGANKPSKDAPSGTSSNKQFDKASQLPSTTTASDIVKTEKKAPTNSCSEFAARTSSDIGTPKPSIVNWMLYRCTFTLTRVPGWHQHEKNPPEYLEKLDFYENFTCLRWPESWRKLDCIPRVDDCLAARRDELFEQYRAFVQEHPSSPPQVMEEQIALLFESRLSLLLNSVAGACTKDARPTRALEAECRHDFDALFMNFFVADVDEPTSSEVFFECTLRLARNTLSQHFKSEHASVAAGGDPYVQLTTRFNEWHKLQYEIYQDVKERVVPQAARPKDQQLLKKICYHTSHGALTLDAQFDALREQPTFHEIVKEQSTMEPATGTCDAALVTLIPITLDPELSKARQMQHTLKSSKLLLIDYGSHKNTLSQRSLPEDDPAEDDDDDPTKSLKGPSLYHHPLIAPSGDYPPRNISARSSKKPLSSSLESCAFVMLPQLLAEYKRPYESETKALNQARMYCLSAIFYYAYIGILDYPVFGFATHGKVGALVMGWMSCNGAAYLLERNVRRFDISEPLQAFHLASIIARLKAREADLQDRFAREATNYVQDLSKGEFAQWYADKPKRKSSATVTGAASPAPASSAATSRGTSLDRIVESDGH